ncbi:hypothetical protein MUK42_15062, partial [Musa troglodytarum]
VKRVSPLVVVNIENSLPRWPSFLASTTSRIASARLPAASCSRCLRGTIAAGTLTTIPLCPPFLLLDSGSPSAGIGADRSAAGTNLGLHRKGRRRRAAARRRRTSPRRTPSEKRAVTRSLAPDVSISAS